MLPEAISSYIKRCLLHDVKDLGQALCRKNLAKVADHCIGFSVVQVLRLFAHKKNRNII